MVDTEARIVALAKLGSWLGSYITWKNNPSHAEDNEYAGFDSIVQTQHIYNQWLIATSVEKAIDCWAAKLTLPSLRQFASRYVELLVDHPVLDIAVVPQQNIPLAGLHDAVCIWLAGHRFLARNINHELDLLEFITRKLIDLEPACKDMVLWVETFPKNTSAYLVYSKPEEDTSIRKYFSARKSLIRQKRSSVAVLSPGFAPGEIEALSADILDFFGHSSRNVRKIYVPAGFTVDQFYPSIESYSWIGQINRYANNFDYHRSVFLMDGITFFENGFLILRESPETNVPIGCVYFEYYQSLPHLYEKLRARWDETQQVVSSADIGLETILPGTAHNYPLWAFDDKQDVMRFLLD